jgi:hypothetical protein
MISPMPQPTTPLSGIGVEPLVEVSALPEATASGVMNLYLRLLPHAFWDELRKKQQNRRNNCVYTAGVVIWLMIVQRWQGAGTLESAVLELVRGLPGEFWEKPCKRLQSGPDGQKPVLSANTGSYNEARQVLPTAMVEECFDRAFQQLILQTNETAPARRVFLIDGTSVRTAHSESLKNMYPPASNQHGESHWPTIRMLVAHDLETGLALRPVWGAMYGSNAVSEQKLLERILIRLPDGAVVLGDRNFGVFTVAYAATRGQHPVLLRMTPERARGLVKGDLVDGMDERVQWQPSAYERQHHPELPAGACVDGRLIARQVQPSDGSAAFLLILFTTLEDPIDEAIALYGKRWNIELDLRTIKSTLRLEQIPCTSPEMVAKEIDVAMLAYNLVRTVMYMAAQKAQLKPRNFSFSRVRRVINAFQPLIAAASDERQANELFEKMMYYVSQAKLYKRNRTRNSYPREAWGQPRVFPKRKA